MNKKAEKKEKIKPIRIDVKKMIQKLLRPVNATLYYNKDSYSVLHPLEISNVSKLMLYFYKKRDNYFGDGQRRGIQPTTIREELGMGVITIRSWLSRLTPAFLNMSFSKIKGKNRIAKFYAINDNGIIFCERLLEKIKNV
jgi:hypothetical protein